MPHVARTKVGHTASNRQQTKGSKTTQQEPYTTYQQLVADKNTFDVQDTLKLFKKVGNPLSQYQMEPYIDALSPT